MDTFFHLRDLLRARAFGVTGKLPGKNWLMENNPNGTTNT